MGKSMIWIIEISELCIAIIPVIVAITVMRFKNASPLGWMIKIVGSTFFALLQIGLLLRRLTATCSAESPFQCTSPASARERVPGVFDFCFYCVESSDTKISEIDSLLLLVNEIALPFQAAGAIITLLISLCITVSFIKAFRASMPS